MGAIQSSVNSSLSGIASMLGSMRLKQHLDTSDTTSNTINDKFSKLKGEFDRQIEEAKGKPVNPNAAKAIIETNNALENNEVTYNVKDMKPITKLGNFEDYIVANATNSLKKANDAKQRANKRKKVAKQSINVDFSQFDENNGGIQG